MPGYDFTSVNYFDLTQLDSVYTKARDAVKLCFYAIIISQQGVCV